MDWGKAQAVRARHKERSAMFAAAAGQPRGLLDSVRRRLMLMVLLALAPIAGLNFVQGAMQLNAAEEDARQRLLQHVIADAASLETVFASAENVLQALKAVADVREGAGACPAILHGALLSLPFASNIGVIDADGRVLCTALPLEEREVGHEAWWLESIADTRFTVWGKLYSRAARAEVLVGVLPLVDVRGSFTGALAIGIDVSRMESLLKRETPAPQGVVSLFSDEGATLVSNAGPLSASLFAGADLSLGRHLREVHDADGRGYTYATAPLGRDGMVAAFALPTDRLFRWTLVTVAASFALPTLIVVVSLIGLWLAVDRIVLQWVMYLRRVTSVYAQGHYSFRPARIDAAPSEFRVLGHAVENMAMAVRERDALLRQGLAEKTALVREIHHRIKNSLQIVVSLISLYGSGVRGEDRRRFDQLRTRVNTLALVHRILYEAAEGSQVRLRELLRELAGLLESACERPARITVEAEDVPVPTDMAVPLALMVVELVLGLALNPAEAGAERGGALPITLQGHLADGRLAIEVSIPAPEGTAPAAGDLAHGFAGQLGGVLAALERGGRLTICGTFPCRLAGR